MLKVLKVPVAVKHFSKFQIYSRTTLARTPDGSFTMAVSNSFLSP